LPVPAAIPSVAEGFSMAFLLLIEADDGARRALKTQLQSAGHTVHAVPNLAGARAELLRIEEGSSPGEWPLTAVQPAASDTGLAGEEPIIPLDEVEFVMVQRALRATRGNQSQAARLLGVSRDQLRYRVKRYRELGRLAACSIADEDVSGTPPSSAPTGSAAARSSESPLPR
jgi:hypothetical protein